MSVLLTVFPERLLGSGLPEQPLYRLG